MKRSEYLLTRRDFIKGTGCAALGLAAGLPALADETADPIVKARVVLVRQEDVIGSDGAIRGEIIQDMLDQAMMALFDQDDPTASWKLRISPDDVVGIKSNEWSDLRTPPELEQAIKSGVMEAGVPEENISIGDRGVRSDPVFRRATALINTRPLRTHAWSGVGSLIKNHIMFTDEPPKYHDNACADLGALWHLPAVKGKTRLNILVMLTPLFHGRGWHHYDPAYIWPYKGLLVSTDPVAADTVGLQILQAKRRAHFGDERPLKPSPHHIVFADTRHHLGTSDPGKIELIRLGWDQDILI